MVKPQILGCLCPKNAFSNLKIFFFQAYIILKFLGSNLRVFTAKKLGVQVFYGTS